MAVLTQEAQKLVAAHAGPGDVVIDATAGNGFDSLFLSQLVGPQGQVYAIDLQPRAIAQARRRLEQAQRRNVTLIEADHARLGEWIPGEHHGHIAAVMFNLGYLPGGNREFVTRPESTLAALNAALGLLRTGGVISIVFYRGHAGAALEAHAIERWRQALNSAYEHQLACDSGAAGPALVSIRRRSDVED
jgi:predicted methyltransferase